MKVGRVLSLVISHLCIITAQAQMLIPLYGACSSSVQCVGVAICINQVCQCPPAYNAVGITCVYGGVDTDLQSLPAPIVASHPPFPMSAPSMAVGVGPPPLPLPGSALAIGPGPPPPTPPVGYPGLPCPPGKACVGNSVCIQGVCGCPAGHVVAGYSCVPPPPFMAGPPPVPRPSLPVAAAPYFPPYGPVPGEELEYLFGPRGPVPMAPSPALPYPPTCPPSHVPLGPACVPLPSIVNFPSPIPCQPGSPTSCAGGAVCLGSYCTCIPPLVWSGSGCVPPAPSVPQHSYPVSIPGPVRPSPTLPVVASIPPSPVPVPVPLGAPCSAHGQCVFGAYCHMGLCQCRPAFLPYGSICVLRRKAKKDETERKKNAPKEVKKARRRSV